MKKKFFYSMLAAATMLVSCNSEDEVVNNNPFSEGEDGYVAFTIQLPQANATTRSNDEFDDGDAVEYQVKNATLVMFTGASENAATFCGAYNMNVNSFSLVGSTTDQCTSEGKVSAKVTAPTVSGKLYAYVIINHNNIISSPSATGVTLQTHDGTSLGTTDVTTATTFEEFSKLVLANIGGETNGFVMVSSPVNNAVAGASAPATKNVSTLAELDKNKIKPTATEAEADPAGEIFVERAAVKVTVSTSLTGTPGLTTESSVKYDAATFAWALQNENIAYYNTRQMDASWLDLAADGTEGTVPSSTKYRFASGYAIHTGVVRTYWGTDVNYNTDVTGSSTYKFKPLPTGVAYIDKAMNTSAYTFENTFDVDRQASKNTTQVALSVKFNGGKSFYIASTNGGNNILQVPDASGTEKKVQEYIMEYLRSNNADFNTWYLNDSKNRITVTMTNRTSPFNGYHKIATVVRETGAATLPTGITETDLVTLINNVMNFKYYENGVAYYRVRIKHFGAELASGEETPWEAGNHSTNNITGVYKTFNGTSLTDVQANANYLGRYGVLRNNWYKLDISGIKQIGYPLPGDPNTPGDPNNPDGPDPWTPDTPDDEVENYIAVKIHVTPWALRKQSVVL